MTRAVVEKEKIPQSNIGFHPCCGSAKYPTGHIYFVIANHNRPGTINYGWFSLEEAKKHFPTGRISDSHTQCPKCLIVSRNS